MCVSKMFAKLILFGLLHSSSGVIYELSDEDYARMPPKFKMDDYEGCFKDPQGLYCMTKFAMVSDKPSPLLAMMQKYSEHFPTHYNHTLLRRGICITRTCKKYYDVSEGNLGSALEACANETFYNEYKLKARLLPDFDCSKREMHPPIDYVDKTVAVVCVAILLVNIVASACDYFFGNEKYIKGLRFLYCFSIFRNWNRLVAPAADGKEPRLRRLSSLHGIRALTMFLVIGGHSIIRSVFFPENERFIENFFSSGPMHLLLSGTLIMQTFLLISSFLLVYNWLIYSEKQKPTWKMLPHMFMMRWLRLTPSFGLILALTATWFGRITSGPTWNKIVADEMYDCRRVWWKYFLYINNYDDDATCMVQAWYLAADTQLYLMAAIVFLLCQTARMRKVVLSLLFVIGIAIPTVITYLRNLDGVLLIYPEFAINIFKGYPTFDEIYKRGHTNVPGCVIGMAAAYWVYDLQKTVKDPKSLRKYRWPFWGMFPLGALCCYSGTLYYSYSPPPSTTVNLLAAAFMKPTFAILIGFLIIGSILELEGVYRTILEYPIWTIPSRLSFSAYLLHVAYLRNTIAMQTSTYRASVTVIISTGVLQLFSAFTAATFYYILAEGPFTAIIREWFRRPEPIEETKDRDSKKKEEDGKMPESIKANGDAIMADNSTRKRVFNKVIDESTIFSLEKNR